MPFSLSLNSRQLLFYLQFLWFCCCLTLSCVQLFVTPWTAACQASLSFTISQSLFRLVSTESVMPFSVIPFCLPSFPASGSFPMSQFFASGGWSIGVSASTWVLPMNTQNWPPLGWTGWIFLQSKGLWRVFSNTTVQRHLFFGTHPFLLSSSDYWNNHSSNYMDLCGKVMCLLLNTLSRFVIVFLPMILRILDSSY